MVWIILCRRRWISSSLLTRDKTGNPTVEHLTYLRLIHDA